MVAFILFERELNLKERGGFTRTHTIHAYFSSTTLDDDFDRATHSLNEDHIFFDLDIQHHF